MRCDSAQTTSAPGRDEAIHPVGLRCGFPAETNAEDAEDEVYDTPAYVVAGELSTYTLTHKIAETLPLAAPYIVIDPYGGHNVISRTECLLELRNTWMDTLSPADPPACLNESSFTWEF